MAARIVAHCDLTLAVFQHDLDAARNLLGELPGVLGIFLDEYAVDDSENARVAQALFAEDAVAETAVHHDGSDHVRQAVVRSFACGRTPFLRLAADFAQGEPVAVYGDRFD